MTALNILLQLQEGTTKSVFEQYSGIIMIALIFVVFYFFLIRPQRTKQKEIAKAREAITVGDKVVLSGGVYGKVREIKETVFIVEISENVRVKVEKNSVFADATQAE
jgi:preprotein translocase subunit YajC